MASPPTKISTEAVTTSILAKAFTEELQKGLDAAAKSREEATPEPTYSTDNFEPPFRYLAELQRKHFTSREAEKNRQRITVLDYWKCEAQCIEATVNEFRGRALKMEDWRNLAAGYRSLLTQIGFTAYQFEQLRLSISGQAYWKHEAEFFKQESNRREYKLKMRWKQNDQHQKRHKQPTQYRVGPDPKLSQEGWLNACHGIIILEDDDETLGATLRDSIGLSTSGMMSTASIMSTTTSADLTDIVLLLANFTGVPEIMNLSNNAAFEFKPPKGWVGGSAPDTDAADVQLAPDNRTGVSKRHFQIDIHPLSCHPRVKVLSRSLRLLTDDNRLQLTQDEDIEIVSSAIFDLGGIGFQAWRPKLTPAEAKAYRRKAMRFSEEAVLALPKYFPPLKSAPETITSNVRYGPNDKVYVYQGHSGKGSSASVMLVQERNSGKTFAAKEPYYKLSDDPGIRRSRWEMLNKEYKHILGLDHPHIVKVHDIVLAQDEKEPAWMIEDYIPDCLHPKDLDDQSAIVVTTQLLSALAQIHSVDIVHRDVKPSNILMKEKDMAILGDFGTAQHCVQGNLDTFAGTPIYLAPEFLEEQRSYTNKVDMFSCGMVLLECLSTWDPQSDSRWPSNTLNRRMHKQWMRRIVLPHISELPEDIRPLQRGLLRRQPEKRWSALKCLAWLGDYAKASGDEGIIRPHTNPRDADQETIQPRDAHIITPERRANERKRPASAALSDQVERDKGRQPQFGEASPLSPDLRWPPSQSTVLRRPASELPSTLAPGASFVTPPPPLQSPVFKGPLSELPSTLAPEVPFVTPPPPSPQVGTALSPNHGLFSYLPNANDYNRASFPNAPPQSPSWAPTPYYDDGEFPVSGEDNEYSTEENDEELLKDWDDSDSEDKD